VLGGFLQGAPPTMRLGGHAAHAQPVLRSGQPRRPYPVGKAALRGPAVLGGLDHAAVILGAVWHVLGAAAGARLGCAAPSRPWLWRGAADLFSLV